MANAVKTNAVRLLTQAGIPLETFTYEVDESDLSGVHIASVLGIDGTVDFVLEFVERKLGVKPGAI